MSAVLVTAPTDPDLIAALIGAGIKVMTESGLTTAPGVIYSYAGRMAGKSHALVDLTGATPELQASASAALTLFVADPDAPRRVVLGGAAPVRSVSPASWRLALLEAGLFEASSQLIAAAGTQAQVVYEFSNKVVRDHPLLAQMGQALGKTDADIEAVFTRAEEIDRTT